MLETRPNSQYLPYNTTRPGLDDVQVRQALNYAVDRQVIIDQVLLRTGRPVATDVPPDSWAYNPKVKQYEYNPDKARQLLDAAGWNAGPDGVRAKDGNQLKFTLWTNSGNKVREAIVTISQQQLNDVGVAVDLQFQDFAAMINRINELDYDMFVSGFVFGADPDNYDLWHSSRKPDPARLVLYGHAVRNALVPVATVLGGSLPALLAGAATTEYVFSWPGMGRLAVDAAGSRDYPVVMGLVLVAAVLILLGNFLSDILYGLIDPRIQLE